MPVDLLVSPLAQGAYFASVAEVARAELGLFFPDAAVELHTRGGLDFLRTDLPEDALPSLARLSFVQGIFAVDGDQLRVLDAAPDYTLPRQLVYGAKYRGKTNELLTLLALNVARATCAVAPELPGKVLDPMAGRGTTLLWAARLGLASCGLERDPRAIDDLQRHVKKTCKLLRIKHKETRGQLGQRRRDGTGRFLRYAIGTTSLRLITGDARHTADTLRRERFPMIVSDLPYGIQHRGKDGWRDPTGVLAACAPVWAEHLLPGGVMVLAFNALLPKRAVMEELFTDVGLELLPFSAPHRMSESILRELVVFRKPGESTRT